MQGHNHPDEADDICQSVSSKAMNRATLRISLLHQLHTVNKSDGICTCSWEAEGK